MTLIDKDAVIKAINNCFGDTVYQVMEQGTFIHKVLDAINALPVKYPFTPDWPPDEAIRETIKERDDALKEVERLTAQLALAEKVMLNLAKILCTPRYDRGDGCGDERKLLASYGWTKE